jgi:MFS family permease
VDVENPQPRSRLHIFENVPPKVKWLIYLVSFASIGYGYLLVAIAAYLPEIGLSSGDVGLILGANGIAFAVSAIPIGLLSDRRGRKWVLILGLMALPPALLVYALTTDVGALLVAAIAAGIAEGAFLTSWNALIADMTTLENRVAAFSFSFIVGGILMSIGYALPFVFPFISEATGFSSHLVHTWTFIILAVITVVSPVTVWILLMDFKEVRRSEARSIKKGSMGPLLKFSALNSLIGLGAGFIIPLIPTWLFLKFGIPDRYSGPLLALSLITIAFAAVASAPLARRYGSVKAIVMTQGLSTIFMFALAFAGEPLLACALYLTRSALMNMSSPLADSFLMGIVPKEGRGLASAINSLIWRLPNSATTIIGGMILAAGIYDVPFFLATAFYVVSIALFYKVFRNVKPRE